MIIILLSLIILENFIILYLFYKNKKLNLLLEQKIIKNSSSDADDFSDRVLNPASLADFNYFFNLELEQIIDIVFHTKFNNKTIYPDIKRLTNKNISIYLYDGIHWQSYYKKTNLSLNVIKIRLIIPLIDKNGLTNKAQLNNIFNECKNYIKGIKAYLEYTEIDETLKNLKEKIPHLKPYTLNFSFKFITKINFQELKNFLKDHFIYNNGVLNNQKYALRVYNDDFLLREGSFYDFLKFIAKIHLVKEYQDASNLILDLFQKLQNHYDIQIYYLNENQEFLCTEELLKQLFSDIESYAIKIKSHNISFGDELYYRLFEDKNEQ